MGQMSPPSLGGGTPRPNWLIMLTDRHPLTAWGPPPPVPWSNARVLLVIGDVDRLDLLVTELEGYGLQTNSAMTCGEAMAAVLEDPADAVVVDAELEGALDLRAWFEQRHRSSVCLVHEFDGDFRRAPPDGEPADDVTDTMDVPDADELVAMLLSGLANVHATHKRQGRA